MSGLVTSRGNSPASWSRPADGWGPAQPTQAQGYLLSVVRGERGGDVHDIILTVMYIMSVIHEDYVRCY